MADEVFDGNEIIGKITATASSQTDDIKIMSSNGGLTTFLLSSPLSTRMPQRLLTPLYNNIFSALLTIIYVRTVMEIGAYIRVKYGVPELSRKFVHLCACSFVIFWPLFDIGHWGWRLNVTVPVVMSFRLVYKVRLDIK